MGIACGWQLIQGCWRSCYQADDGDQTLPTEDTVARSSSVVDSDYAPSPHSAGSKSTPSPFVADCIIANPPSFAHIYCAEALGIPVHIMFTMPYSPTQAFAHPLANTQTSDVDLQLTNYISYTMIEIHLWQGLGSVINRFRDKCLNLEPISSLRGPGILQRLKIPHTYCWSPALVPKPRDWGSHISISGFNLLPEASDYQPTAELQAFLDSGSPPIYVGFGSIVLEQPAVMMHLITDAVRKTGQRLLVSQGWAGLNADDAADHVFVVGDVPHDWLFRHVSCVVHHGGAGTTAAGVAAGRPTVVVPFFGDQAFWGAMVARAGAGPDPIPHKHLTVDNLAQAIDFCLRPQTIYRARELAGQIANEKGTETAAQSFYDNLDTERLRYMLAPSRVATWRIKRTGVRLSAFAASTLANAGPLDFRDLEAFRAREYDTSQGPWDPLTGLIMSTCAFLGNVTRGVTEVPSETWRALQLPFRSNTGSGSALLTPAEANQDYTRQASDSGASMSSETGNHLTGKHFGQDPPEQESSRSIGERDMLRRTGAHGSKGIGRIMKTAVEYPMDVALSVTEGFHNMPRLWGDDTVRPMPRIHNFLSGAEASGKAVGFGVLDGVTGLFSQPWDGARQNGFRGFVKSVGKGIGGAVTKPSAGIMGMFAYVMKGGQKQFQG